MTKVGTWICSIVDENIEIASASRNTAFALNSRIIIDVVGIEIALRLNETYLTETVDIRCMRTVIVLRITWLLVSKTGLHDFRGRGLICM